MKMKILDFVRSDQVGGNFITECNCVLSKASWKSLIFNGNP